MEKRKTKLRYVEITDIKLKSFLKEANYPRRYWAMRKIEIDQNKNLEYIKFLEAQMDKTHDSFKLSLLIAKRNMAVREFFAARKCYLAIQQHEEELMKKYEAAHGEGYKPSAQELRRWRAQAEKHTDTGRARYGYIS